MRSQGATGSVTFSERKFNGVRVFSATMMNDRDQLGDRINAWLAANPKIEPVEVCVTQSSDEQFHCITLTVFYYEEPKKS